MTASLSAVVVRWSRSRKRYERRGLLVTAEGLAQAEAECVADAPERAARRAQDAGLRQAQDLDFAQEMTRELLRLYPACPPAEAQAIARHTAERGSGRVGRTAAGQALEPIALTKAVGAYIRHRHTNYDELLMQGVERPLARDQVRDQIDRVLLKWRGARAAPQGAART